eukprot:TRINITY_DN7899_c0_g1_i1.p1 TRINITY_DN7899_c0_g1~~TRINITY_DN7899_c0_g1_i1.p1  ORF type:complete len:674 (+),score=179.16 TRINITY_DN7899_c0_g1_i1:88-2109(+)
MRTPHRRGYKTCKSCNGPTLSGGHSHGHSPSSQPASLSPRRSRSPVPHPRRQSPLPAGQSETGSVATARSSQCTEGGPREKRERVYTVPVSYSGPQWPTQIDGDEEPGHHETAGHSPVYAKVQPTFKAPSFFCQTPGKLDRGGDLCVVMVGLPGRGKTYYAHKLCRYINWLGINARGFLVSEYLRQPRYMDERGLAKFRAEYYSPANEDALAERMSALTEALIDIRGWLTEDGQVAILDGQATTLHFRTCIHKALTTLMTARRIMYLEIVMDNKRAEELYELKVRSVAGMDRNLSRTPSEQSAPTYLNTPPAKIPACLDGATQTSEVLGTECGEYAGLTLEEAVEDFKQRVQIFESNYVPLAPGQVHNALQAQAPLDPEEGEGVAEQDDDSVYIRVLDGGAFGKTKFEVTGVRGFLPSRLVNWLFNLSPSHRLKHPIFFCRHGQSEFNIADRIGGDPPLTQRGWNDAQLIAGWIRRQEFGVDELEVWTSRLQRTIETARPLQKMGYKTLRWRALNEIHAGICEGLTYAEVKESFPFIEHWRKEDKYTFRYPEGESYQDLVTRLEPVLMELECAERPVLVVSHQAVLRCIFAYFEESAAEKATSITVPQATVWEYHPTGQGVGQLRHYCLRDMSDLTGMKEMTFGSTHPTPTTPDTPAPAAAAALAAPPLLPSS